MTNPTAPIANAAAAAVRLAYAWDEFWQAVKRLGEADRTHGGNHAPLAAGTWLDPGFCGGCDEERTRVLPPGADRGASDD